MNRLNPINWLKRKSGPGRSSKKSSSSDKTLKSSAKPKKSGNVFMHLITLQKSLQSMELALHQEMDPTWLVKKAAGQVAVLQLEADAANEEELSAAAGQIAAYFETISEGRLEFDHEGLSMVVKFIHIFKDAFGDAAPGLGSLNEDALEAWNARYQSLMARMKPFEDADVSLAEAETEEISDWVEEESAIPEKEDFEAPIPDETESAIPFEQEDPFASSDIEAVEEVTSASLETESVEEMADEPLPFDFIDKPEEVDIAPAEPVEAELSEPDEILHPSYEIVEDKNPSDPFSTPADFAPIYDNDADSKTDEIVEEPEETFASVSESSEVDEIPEHHLEDSFTSDAESPELDEIPKHESDETFAPVAESPEVDDIPEYEPEDTFASVAEPLEVDEIPEYDPTEDLRARDVVIPDVEIKSAREYMDLGEQKPDISPPPAEEPITVQPESPPVAPLEPVAAEPVAAEPVVADSVVEDQVGEPADQTRSPVQLEEVERLKGKLLELHDKQEKLSSKMTGIIGDFKKAVEGEPEKDKPVSIEKYGIDELEDLIFIGRKKG